MRVSHNEQFKLLERLHHVGHARHGVATMTEDHHGLQTVALIDIIRLERRGIEPTGRGNARQFHIGLAVAGRTTGFFRHFIKAREQPIIFNLPNARPMFPRTFNEAVVERQRGNIEAHIGGALHIAVATENIGTTAEDTDIAGGEQQIAISAHIGRADRMLCAAHAPDEG